MGQEQSTTVKDYKAYCAGWLAAENSVGLLECPHQRDTDSWHSWRAGYVSFVQSRMNGKAYGV